jgi:hypothetical protein
MQNWKTSLVGALAGILLTVGGTLEERKHDPTTTLSMQSVLQGAAVAVLGLLSRDHDKAS